MKENSLAVETPTKYLIKKIHIIKRRGWKLPFIKNRFSDFINFASLGSFRYKFKKVPRDKPKSQNKRLFKSNPKADKTPKKDNITIIKGRIIAFLKDTFLSLLCEKPKNSKKKKSIKTQTGVWVIMFII